MSLSSGAGRFGNHFIRHLAWHIICTKYDLKSEYEGNKEEVETLIGYSLFSGNNYYSTSKEISNDAVY